MKTKPFFPACYNVVGAFKNFTFFRLKVGWRSFD